MEAFVLNPAARSFRPEIIDVVRRRFPAALLETTRGPGDGARLAGLLVERGAERVVACGGDGTFREVASGVGGRAILGFVPLGTVNLLASELGIPSTTEEALTVLATDFRSEMFGGRCHAEGDVEPRLFFIGVSAGPDADVVHAVTAPMKRLAGRYAYGGLFLSRLLRAVEPEIGVSWDGESRNCGQLLALRLPHYGGRYRLSATLSLFRPGLELVAVERGRLAVLRLFWSAFRSRPGPVRRGWRAPTDAAVVTLPESGRYQVDGDPFTAKRLRLWSDPTPIRVTTPRP